MSKQFIQMKRNIKMTTLKKNEAEDEKSRNQNLIIEKILSFFRKFYNIIFYDEYLKEYIPLFRDFKCANYITIHFILADTNRFMLFAAFIVFFFKNNRLRCAYYFFIFSCFAFVRFILRNY